MSRESKLSMLGQLLERVRKRATTPRAAAAAAPSAAKEPTIEALAAEPAAMAPSPAPKPIAEAPQQVLPPPTRAESPPSEPPPELDSDAEEGPPSAPRLREARVAAAEEAAADEQDFPEEEVPIKTPPPESGRQHVAPAVPAADSSDDLDIEISVTVTEGEITPLPPGPSAAPPEHAAEPLRMPAPPGDLGLPRLAFVSEPEIEFHVRPRAPAVKTADASSGASQQEGSPSSAVVSKPAGAPRAPEAAAPDLLPTPSDVPPSAPPTPIPVRLMAQPAVEVPGAPAVPVEVWASTHAPAEMRARVASFVGQNASFVPKSFGDLLEATLQLGEDRTS